MFQWMDSTSNMIVLFVFALKLIRDKGQYCNIFYELHEKYWNILSWIEALTVVLV